MFYQKQRQCPSASVTKDKPPAARPALTTASITFENEDSRQELKLSQIHAAIS